MSMGFYFDIFVNISLALKTALREDWPLGEWTAKDAEKLAETFDYFLDNKVYTSLKYFIYAFRRVIDELPDNSAKIPGTSKNIQLVRSIFCA